MKGDLRKLFHFLSSEKKQLNPKKLSRSSSIACPREVVRSQGTSSSVIGLKNDGADGKKFRFNHTIPKRRKPKPVKMRSMTVPGGVTSQERNFCAPSVFDKLDKPAPEHSSRKRIVNVDIGNSIILMDLEIEDIQNILRSLQDRSIYHETSIHEGLLTTTLCSTEL